MEVETLIPQLQDTLSEIKVTLNGLSAKAQYDKLEQLEHKREHQLSDLQASFEKERQELEQKRRKKLEDIKKKRKQEDEERAAQRRREDEELTKANSKEDAQHQQRRSSAASSIEDETEHKLDEAEEAARKLIQEGKHKLHELDERRKELNRRIDEQLKQPLPSLPLRRRDKQKKESASTSKAMANGDSVPNDIPNPELHRKESKKGEASSKHRPPPSADSSEKEKSPEAKKEGELPFQDVPKGLQPATMKSSQYLPSNTFTEALKNMTMSNASKGKPKYEKGSLDTVSQEEGHDEPGVVRHDDDTNVLTSKKDAAADERIWEAESNIGDGRATEHIKLLPNEKFGREKATVQGKKNLSGQNASAFQPFHSTENYTLVGSKLLNQREPAQRAAGLELAIVENDSYAASEGREPKQETLAERPSEQHGTTIVGGEASAQFNQRVASSERTKVPESTVMNIDTPTDTSKATAHTVGAKSTIQSPRLSSTLDERNPRQYDETFNQMGLERPGTPDSSQQSHSRPPKGRLPLEREVAMSSAELATHAGFDMASNMSAGHPSKAQRTRLSPLPVENETVRGQEQLFDDHKSASDHLEHHNTDDEELDSLPHTPIEGEHLPVLLEPILKDRHDDRGLPMWMDETGSWAIATETADKNSLPQIPSKPAPDQEIRNARNLTQSYDVEGGTRGNSSQNDNHGGQGPSQPQRDPVKMLYSHVVAGLFGPGSETARPSPHVAEPTESQNPPSEPCGTSDERPLIHSRQRGRQMDRSFSSPERTLNPREQLFQRNEDDIDIRGSWFKHSKRGLS
ncbi:hypothetical protein F5Y14DRAFT_451449 [Nemania sp. NC0429]|nr:hypothetical protein F5Y14DRAFT_451449 [Nemania sp. NC0429]